MARLALLREIVGTLARRAEGRQRFTEAYRALAPLPAPMRAAVRLRAMADDLARLFAGRWPAATLTVAVADDPCRTLDRDQLEQAIWAPLRNAAEAAAPGTDACVALRMHVTGAGLAIDVEDDGPAVPPYVALDGTGVGLSLARRIALPHGGTLTLRSGPPTAFRFTLPGAGRHRGS